MLYGKISQTILNYPYEIDTCHEIINLISFNRIYTTNWDNILAHYLDEKPCVFCQTQVNYIKDHDLPHGKIPYIFKVHGDAESPSTIVFDESDRKKYYNTNNLMGYLTQRFNEDSFLFIGFSFWDKEIIKILNDLNTKNADKPPVQHYAILRWGSSVCPELFGMKNINWKNPKYFQHQILQPKMNNLYVFWVNDHNDVWRFLSSLQKTEWGVDQKYSWKRVYIETERPDYLRQQLIFEQKAYRIDFITWKCTNALTVDGYFDRTYPETLKDILKLAAFKSPLYCDSDFDKEIWIKETVDLMRSRYKNIVSDNYGSTEIEINVLFTEDGLRSELDGVLSLSNRYVNPLDK